MTLSNRNAQAFSPALAESLLPKLLPLATSDNVRSNIKSRALSALGSLGPSVASRAVPVFISGLLCGDDFCMNSAVDGLAKMGPAAKVAIPQLKQLAADNHAMSARFAAQRLLSNWQVQ